MYFFTRMICVQQYNVWASEIQSRLATLAQRLWFAHRGVGCPTPGTGTAQDTTAAAAAPAAMIWVK